MSEQVAQFFKAWRKHRGLTQEQAAAACNLARAYLSELETGRKRHNEDILIALAHAYDCEPWQLLGQDPGDAESSGNVIDIWEHIPASRRKQALAVLKTFTDKNSA